MTPLSILLTSQRGQTRWQRTCPTGSEPVSINGMWAESVEIHVSISALDFFFPPVVKLKRM